MYVITKFIPATNTKPERIKATLKHPLCSVDVSVTIPFDQSVSPHFAHQQAFNAVLRKAGQCESSWLTVSTADGALYVPEWACHVKFYS